MPALVFLYQFRNAIMAPLFTVWETLKQIIGFVQKYFWKVVQEMP